MLKSLLIGKIKGLLDVVFGLGNEVNLTGKG